MRYKVAGKWKIVDAEFVKRSGVWKQVVKRFVKEKGHWVETSDATPSGPVSFSPGFSNGFK